MDDALQRLAFDLACASALGTRVAVDGEVGELTGAELRALLRLAASAQDRLLAEREALEAFVEEPSAVFWSTPIG